MFIKENHIFLTASQHVATIAEPLIQLGITYFSYGRYYNNGGRLWLCNMPEILKSYYQNDLYKIGNTECHPSNYQDQVVLWSTLPNQQVFEDSKQLGIDHGIFIIKPQSECCEFFAFATFLENRQIINTYLSNIEWLKKFGTYFKERAKNIIKKAENNKIYLPYHDRPLVNNIDFSFYMKQSFAANKLTSRQISCARLLIEGKSINEIATYLKLSPRTVETYLNNIKSKLNCINRTELIIKLSEII